MKKRAHASREDGVGVKSRFSRGVNKTSAAVANPARTPPLRAFARLFRRGEGSDAVATVRKSATNTMTRATKRENIITFCQKTRARIAQRRRTLADFPSPNAIASVFSVEINKFPRRSAVAVCSRGRPINKFLNRFIGCRCRSISLLSPAVRDEP